MKFNVSLVAALVLISFNGIAASELISTFEQPVPPNTQVTHYSSEENGQPLSSIQFDRTGFYPTQIVRVQGDVSPAQVKCSEVTDTIEELFTGELPSDLFYYNTYVFCGYDPKTGLATNFTINSYFDPLSNKAISYYEQLKADIEGQLIFGVPFHIEDAKGTVISLRIEAGLKDSPEDTNLLMFRKDVSTHYFASNYDVMKELVSDIKARFRSLDPQVVLPFMDRWFFAGAGAIYSRVLPSSNYVEIQPTRIFLMEQPPQVFTSILRFSYAHLCFNTPTGKCL